MGSVMMGMIAGLATGLATIVGALPILHKAKNWNPWRILNLDFAMGMMLAASAFNLIGPAYSHGSSIIGVTVALGLGVLSIHVFSRMIHRWAPTGQNRDHSRAWLFVIAMMLHNLPEGLASGAALSAPSSAAGWTAVTAIIVQNFPEGLATAAAFLSIGFTRKKAFFGAAATGLMEIFGGSIGALFTATTSSHLPLILAFAGGAMMSVTLSEIMENIRQRSISYLLNREFIIGSLAIILMNLALS
jgi:ZIP family zinc transporter